MDGDYGPLRNKFHDFLIHYADILVCNVGFWNVGLDRLRVKVYLIAANKIYYNWVFCNLFPLRKEQW